MAQPVQLLHQMHNHKNGLVGGEVLHLVQDSSGFIWVMTAKGLFRYNGDQFEFFNEKTGLPGVGILRGCIDKEQRLWIITLEGEIYFYEHNRFHQSWQFPDAKAKWIFRDADQNITIAYANGEVWLLKNAQAAAQPIKAPVSEQYVITANWEDRQHILFTERNGLFRYYLDTRQISCLFQSGKLTPFEYLRTFHLKEGFFYSYDGKIYDLNTHQMLLDAGSEVMDIINYRGKWWIVAFNALLVWDPASPQEAPQVFFTDKNLQTLLLDRDQGLWIGCKEGLIQLLQPDWYWELNTPSQPVSVIRINPLSSRLYAITNQHELLSHQNGKWQHTGQQLFEKRQIGNEVSCLHNGSFCSYNVFSLAHFHSAELELELKAANNQILLNYTLLKQTATIHENGIAILHLKIVKHFNKNNPFGIIRIVNKLNYVKDYTISFLPDNQEHLFLQGPQKEELLILQAKRWLRFRMNGATFQLIDSASFQHVPSLMAPDWISPDKIVWAGANRKLYMGLPWKVTDSLNLPEISAGEEIKYQVLSANFLWIASSDNIYRYNHKQNQWTKVALSPIAQGISIQDLAVKKGVVIVATDQGMISFPETAFALHHYRVQFHIDSSHVSITGKQLFPWDKINRVLHLQLQRIDFNVPHTKHLYVSLGDNSLKLQPGWQRLPANKPGIWPVKVAAEEEGIEDAYPLVWIEVPYLWWEPVWIKVAGILLLAGIIIITGLFFIRQHIRKIEHRRKLAQERLKSLQLQINPHFLYNTLTSIQKYVMIGETEQTLTYIADFSLLMRMITQYSKTDLISLQEEIEFLSLYLQLEQKRQGFTYEIELDTICKSQTEEIMLPPLLIQPIVENAVKYAMSSRKIAGTLLLSFRLIPSNHLLEVNVRDNGPGFSRSLPFSTGTGLKNTTDRLKALWEREHKTPTAFISIKPISKTASFPGTEVTLKIPLS